jgi:hypothetical protein
MPSASRAWGDKIVVTEVLSGAFFFGFVAALRLGAGFLDARADDARDDVRREGEVFVAIGR